MHENESFMVGFTPLAHRGFSRTGEENSLAAFQAAWDLGVRWMETDVNTTADGVVLSIHDETLDRTTNGSGKVSDARWSDLREIDDPPATMEDVLLSLPEAYFNIDVKDEASAVALPELIRRTGAGYRVRIASFSDRRRRRTLRRLRRLTGHQVSSSAGGAGVVLLLVSALVDWPWWSATRRLFDRWIPEFEAVQLPERFPWRPSAWTVPVVTDRLLDYAHRHGVAVHVWTVNEADRMVELIDRGVDGIVTDRSDLLMEVLREKGMVR